MRDFAILIGLVLAWGSGWLAVKIGLGSAPPFWFATIRFVISFILLGVIILIKKPDYTFVRKNIGKIFIAGSGAYGICYALTYWGQGHISSGTASVLFASIPFFTAAFSVRFLPEEKVTALRMAGVVIGFSGIVVIYFGDISLRGDMALWGAGMVVLSSAVAASVSIIVKRGLKHVDSLLLTHTQMIPGILILMVIALINDDFSEMQLDITTVISTLYLSVFVTAFAFWAYFYLLARTNVLKLSLIGFMTPVIAIFLGWIVLDEEITGRFAIGVILVLLGVWFATRETKTKEKSNDGQSSQLPSAQKS